MLDLTKLFDEPSDKENTPENSTPETAGRQPEDPIELAVQFINQKVLELGSASEAIGAYVLENIFHGDLEVASSKDPRKGASGLGYRKLCKHPDLKTSASSLSRKVRVAALSELLEREGIQAATIPYAHKIELLKIEDPVARAEMARSIITAPVSSRELASRIKGDRARVSPQYLTESQSGSSFLKVFEKSRPKAHLMMLQCILVDTEIRALLGNSEEQGEIDQEMRHLIDETRNAIQQLLPQREVVRSS